MCVCASNDSAPNEFEERAACKHEALAKVIPPIPRNALVSSTVKDRLLAYRSVYALLITIFPQSYQRITHWEKSCYQECVHRSLY